jgi:hypothetical protein
MSRRPFILPIRAVVIFLLIVAALAVPLSFAMRARAVPGDPPGAAPTPAAARPEPAFAVNRAELDPRVVRALDALGGRFENPALGRTLLFGTLTRHAGGSPETAHVRVVRELPDRLRYEERRGLEARVLGYDGGRGWSQRGEPNGEESALVESLARDSVEHFVAGQAAGDATRALGDHFRADGGTDPSYAGPYYDILRVDDSFASGGQRGQRPMLYYLDSRTGLPAKIVYERGPAESRVRVEVEFSDWAEVAGQRYPRRVTRRENGDVTLELQITQALFAPAARDGSFDPPGAR